jgi:uncharacterized protein (TIGR02172 family)
MPSPVTIAALGKPIAFGRTSEIYAWGDDQILKLAYPQFSGKAVDYEADVARKVAATGLRVPAVGEVIELEGRRGIVYERINGTPQLGVLMQQPWRSIQIMRLQAELHAAMHTQSAPTLPAQRQRLIRAIHAAAPLAAKQRAAALRVLDELPDHDRLCHGDFHPDNVLITPSGPVIIDWMDATHGHPLADVARLLLLLRLAGLPPRQPARRLHQAFRAWVWAIYFRRYCQLQTVDHALLTRWQIPVLAARLAENVDDEAGALHYLDSLFARC